MKPIDLTALTTESVFDRASKVRVADLGKPAAPSSGLCDLLDSLPKQLAANSLRRLRDHLVRCHGEGRTVGVGIGGHVIKTGCAPYLIDWIQRGLVKSVSMNGSAAIHDYELALAGHTSEDVGKQLPAGRFGMARESAEAFTIASERGAKSGIGLGAAIGQFIGEMNCPHADISLVHAAWKAKIPCTIHVALGTDIVHMHPQVSGAALGQASLLDFRILCSVVASLSHGMWMNIGSAVIMPEVFLKAVSVVRNLDYDLNGLVSVNLDKEPRYRTLMNVLNRPSSEGIEITGHHEILIPLLHAAVAAGLAAQDRAAA